MFTYKYKHTYPTVVELYLWSPSLHTSHCCSVAKSCLTICNPMNCSTTGFPVLHYLPEFAQFIVLSETPQIIKNLW